MVDHRQHSWLRRALLVIVILALALPVVSAQAAPAGQSAVTATTTVNLRVRSGPGTTFTQLSYAPTGTVLTVVGRNADSTWLNITINGTQGWVAAWYTNISGDLNSVPVISGAASATTVTGVTVTTTDYLRLRAGPGTDTNTLAIAPIGTTVPVVGRNASSTWINVSFNGTTGWMSAYFVTVSGDLFSVPINDGSSGAAAAPPAAAGPVTASVATNLNYRTGPDTSYTLLGYVPSGTVLTVLGRNSASNWLYVNYNGQQVWVAGWYTNISGNLSSTPVVSAPPPTPSAPGGSTPGVSLPAISSGSFALGGQTQSFSHPDLMRSAGMTWVKFQQKWTPGMDPSIVAGAINSAHAQGFRVLISSPGQLYPGSIDYASYVQFLRGVAQLGADAIEVWNEMNLNREWPSGQVNPATYVNSMLAPAYAAIKAASPNTIVIAGALAPTGVNIGNDIMSDDRYLAGMRDAGAANYMDCLGVHHNAGATSPDATTGHPADGGAHHYSWYFGPTFNLYAGTFPHTALCYTELGYLTPDGYGTLPSTFSWGQNTSLAEHAQWLGRAVQLLRQSGRVRLAVIFNVDFTSWGDDPQAGYAILRPDGSCPACSTLAAAMR